MNKLWPVILLGAMAIGCDDAETVASRLNLTTEVVELAAEKFEDPTPVPLAADTDDYIDNLFGNINPSTLSLNLGLPNYAYFQGLIYTRQNFFMAGQVRVVGGVVAENNLSIAGDGMLTTNPESQFDRISVGHARWKVESWIQE